MGGRYDLSDFDWSVIEPLLPNKPRGVPRVDDRRVLNGEPCALPVKLGTVMPLLGYRSAVAGFIALHEADPEALGDDRTINFPSHAATVEQIIAALRRVAGNRHLGEVTVEPDPAIEAIVATWATETEFARATALGLPKEANLDDIVRAYIEDFLNP